MSSFLKIRWARYRRVDFAGSRQPCPLCGNGETAVISRFDRWFNPLVNVLCRRCGLIFLDPMPTDEELDQYYKHQFWSRSQGSEEPTPRTIERATRHAQGRLSNLSPFLRPGMRILDVGAGGGEFLHAAQQQGFEVEGIEPSVGYAGYCRKTYGLNVRAATLADADLGDRKFDLITCNHSLEHMRDPLRALQRLHEHLQPGGHLYVSVPDLGGPNMWPLRYFHAGHMCGFTYETLIMMAAKAGFAPADHQPFGRIATQVFRRLPAADVNWFRFPDHAAAAEIKWRRETAWRYLVSPRTYRRIPGRIGYFLTNRVLSLRRPSSPKRPQKQA